VLGAAPRWAGTRLKFRAAQVVLSKGYERLSYTDGGFQNWKSQWQFTQMRKNFENSVRHRGGNWEPYLLVFLGKLVVI